MTRVKQLKQLKPLTLGPMPLAVRTADFLVPEAGPT
jgi:hypothetical protein